jgi:hypothetical protein
VPLPVPHSCPAGRGPLIVVVLLPAEEVDDSRYAITDLLDGRPGG